jgi:hypothetical protein
MPLLLSDLTDDVLRKLVLEYAPVPFALKATCQAMRRAAPERTETPIQRVVVSLALIRWARAMGMGWKGTEVMTAAAAAGDLSVVVYAGEMHAPRDQTAVYAACRHGHLDVVDWLVGSGCPWKEKNEDENLYVGGKACEAAAKGGHLHVLQFLRSQHMNATWNYNTPQRAAERGHLQVLQWAMENHCPVNQAAYAGAATYGHIHILEYLQSMHAPYAWLAANEAAREGHVHVLKWFAESETFYMLMQQDLLKSAARENQIKVLEWVCSQPDDRFDDRFYEGFGLTVKVMAAAAEGGHVEAMQWLRDRGTDWNTDVSNAAAREGKLEALKWLVDKGCPFDPDAAIKACFDCFAFLEDEYNNGFDVFKWIIEKFAPLTGWRYYEDAYTTCCTEMMGWLEERYPKECQEYRESYLTD